MTELPFPRNYWPRCTCPWAVRSLGRLHGIDMGKGLVRLSTDPDCPHHAEPLA